MRKNKTDVTECVHVLLGMFNKPNAAGVTYYIDRTAVETCCRSLVCVGEIDTPTVRSNLMLERWGRIDISRAAGMLHSYEITEAENPDMPEFPIITVTGDVLLTSGARKVLRESGLHPVFRPRYTVSSKHLTGTDGESIMRIADLVCFDLVLFLQ